MTEAASVAPPDPVVARAFSLRVEHADDDARVLAAVDEAGEVLGIASAGRSRDPDSATDWELYAVNTVASVRGTGLSDALLVEVLGGRPASLWVLLGNERALAFYRRHGFVADGAQRVHEGSGAPEQRLVRRAVAAAPYGPPVVRTTPQA